MYRFESKCLHEKAVSATIKHFCHGNGDWRRHEKRIDWNLADMKFVCIADETQTDPAVIHPEGGDLSAFNLVYLLTSATLSLSVDILKEMQDKDSFLNPQRIYAELKHSADNGVSLTDDAVLKLGRALPKLSKKDVELDDDFDENLTPAASVAETAPAVQAKALDWKSVKRPNPASFYVKPEVWEQALYTMAHGGNVLITGPSGSGKSELAYIAAKGMNMPIAAFNFGAMQEPRTSLIGATHFDVHKGTFTKMSRFAQAVSQPRGTILLDEISRDRGASAHNIILTLLDRQGYMSLDEHEDSPIIRKGEHVCFLATANLGMEYTGTEALDKALRDRMDVVIDMEFPPKEYEVKIMMFRCPGLRAGDASRLVDIAVRQREMTVNDGEFTEQISTRMLIAAGMRIGNGMKFEDAVQFCVVNQFTNEGGDASDRTKIAQIVQKGGK